MRILHVGKYFPPVPGGIETLLMRLLDATAGLVENVAVVAGTGGSDTVESRNGYTVHRLRRRGEFLLNPVLPGLPAFLRRALAGGVDIVALHFPNLTGAVAYLLARPFRGPEKLIVYYHAEVVFDRFPWNVLGRFYNVLERRFLRRADRIVVSSPNMAEQSPQLLRFRDKISVIHYPLEPGWEDLTDSQREETIALRGEHGDRIVLFAGRLVPYKGVDVLISAARSIRGKILIAGDGPLMEHLQGRVRAEGLSGKVVFAGRVGDLKPYFAACSLFAMPSVSPLEAFGIVQMEAMAFAKPCVSTDLRTGVTYINRAGETGFVVPVGDPGALSEAVNRLLDDAGLRARMGDRARDRVLSEFSAEAVGKASVALYARLAGSA